MSDQLDNFFAKKDKKKSARKNTGSKGEDSKSSKDKSNSADLVLRHYQPEDDGEWADYEEQTEKDYSNLKIQTLIIKDKEEEFREQKELEARLAREALEQQTGGPWRTKTSAKSEEPEVVEPPKPSVPAAKYIPPSQRSVTKSNTGPEIKNEKEFPTLGSVSAK